MIIISGSERWLLVSMVSIQSCSISIQGDRVGDAYKLHWITYQKEMG